MRSPVQLRPHNKVILCIDDDETVLECEKQFLETFGFTVLTAPSGGEGLELADEHSVDVVIVDYFMPEMNGHEVAVELRRLKPQARGAISKSEISRLPYAIKALQRGETFFYST
jgi:CheY-like chemotaxis protein